MKGNNKKPRSARAKTTTRTDTAKKAVKFNGQVEKASEARSKSNEAILVTKPVKQKKILKILGPKDSQESQKNSQKTHL